jgi:type IV pilus assembly protein PilE
MQAATRRPVPPHVPRAIGGYTLIEIMIGLAIIAILASLAVPAFFDSIRKGRRSEAMAALTAVQQAQERLRANVTSYTSNLDDLKLGSKTPNGYYEIAIDAANGTGYTVTATAAGTQAKDTLCHAMRVQVAGGNILYGSACKTCEMTAPLTDANRCWSR